MIPTTSFASLCFFMMDRYSKQGGYSCDFSTSPRPHFAIVLVTEGQVTLTSQGRSIDVFPGEVFLVPVGARYVSCWQGDSTHYTIRFSFFAGTDFPGDRALEIQKICPRYAGEFTSLFIPAYHDFSREGGCNFSSLSYFFEIMARITPRLIFTEKPKLDERIERVITHIEANYSENTSTAYLASIAHMSVSRFHVTFKAQAGTTPIDYRNTIRIRYAIMGILQGGKTIEAISRELGFESVTYFRRVFKREVGCPPSKYNKINIRI